MLILSRKLNESIVIDGKIVVKVLRIERDTVKLGIQAPAELAVHRQEIYDAIQRARHVETAPGQTSHGPSSSSESPAAPSPPPSTAPPKNPSGG